MPTECPPALFELEPVERRKVVVGFDGGIVTSDAGGLLAGQRDRGLGLIRRVFGRVPSHEDVNHRHKLHHDPVFAVLTGTLEGERSGRAPKAA